MGRLLRIFFCAFLAVMFIVGAKEVVMAQTKVIQLPRPKTKGSMSVEETIALRRSERSFSAQALTQEAIAQLLWAAQGITGKGNVADLRAAPSAGAYYPMEIYLLSKDGLFLYIPDGHKLEFLKSDDQRSALASVAGQAVIAAAPVDIVIGGVPKKIAARYGNRGIRYFYMEAGHIAENIHLQAVSLGLVSVPVGAFDDTTVQQLLGLPPECRPLYIIPVGYKGTGEKSVSAMGELMGTPIETSVSTY